jgi:MOSC domain
MNASPSPAPRGRVVSLHLHPTEPGAPLQTLPAIEAIAGKGILNEPRYFERISRRTGQPSRRQVSLIEREQIAAHTAALRLEGIPPGAVRANVETEGIELAACLGCRVQIGEAVLLIYEARLPCEKMDAVCRGLRELMQHNRQGVLAEVLSSGTIRVGDPIAVCFP